MSANYGKAGDMECIDMRERWETHLWMEALDIDERTLRKAVSEVGTEVESLKHYLSVQRSKASKLKRRKKSARSARA
jgi:hypothetical protein